MAGLPYRKNSQKNRENFPMTKMRTEEVEFFPIGQLATNHGSHLTSEARFGNCDSHSLGKRLMNLSCPASWLSVSGGPRSRPGSIAQIANCLARLSPGRV
jgi:hypothetical protein